ncbi:TPA: hypothetical protein WHR30_000202 [Neisseria meningitidis]
MFEGAHVPKIGQHNGMRLNVLPCVSEHNIRCGIENMTHNIRLFEPIASIRAKKAQDWANGIFRRHN